MLITPARLRIFFANHTAKAVILRRGPSKWERMILWHVDRDEFEFGQWFHGSILGGDLSPDGKTFLYTAAKYGGKVRGIWTALSKPPYFTAFALLDVASGYASRNIMIFDGNTDILYDFPTEYIKPTHTKDGEELPKQFSLKPYQEKGYLSSKRLIRDGWRLQTAIPADEDPWRYLQQTQTTLIWLKESLQGVLIAQMDYRVFPWRISFVYQGQETLLKNYEFIDFDQQGRLIATRNGQLLVLNPANPNSQFTVLADFNDQKTEAISAPDWVKHW